MSSAVPSRSTDRPRPGELLIWLDAPLPDQLPSERPNAILIAGACASASGPVGAVEVGIDGRSQPAMACAMPRPDIAALAGPRASRSGFWAIVPIPASREPREVAVDLKARCDDGSVHRRRLGSIQLRGQVLAQSAPTSGDVAHAERGRGPLVAICMATHEPPLELFQRQIDSIRGQTNSRWICLISDDNSSPGKLSEIERLLGNDRRFTLSSSRRRLGFFHNFERALRLVPPDAEYVALADQDDLWYPEKLDTLLGAIRSASVAYSDARIVNADGVVLSPTYWNLRRNSYSNFPSLLLANTVSGSAALFRRDVIDLGLPFPRSAGLWHDHWLAVVGLAIGKIAYVDRPLYDYVQHPDAVVGHEGAHAWAAPGRGVPARLRHFLRDPNYFFEHWRTTYFREYCGLALMAGLLLERCGPELTVPRRLLLRRLANAERSPSAIVWLALRQLRTLGGRTETLGAEGRLLRAILWRWLLAAGSTARGRGRSWLPLSGAYPTAE